ncbi:Carboxypeptidase S [Yarrowia sp. C11]|nr:Carboxypeptidase S [Yarrowia sp. C11]KAG5364026.1 Carboxypeptidase S [Yarrowia sp. E02]
MDPEKQQLKAHLMPDDFEAQIPKAPRPNWMKRGLVATVFGMALLKVSHMSRDYYGSRPGVLGFEPIEGTCPSQPKLVPQGYSNLDFILHDEEFAKGELKRFQGAIQIPTQSYDDLGPVGEDSRWDIFYDFSSYLEKAYPLAHKHMTVERVNTHGLIFTWEGSDSSLKPQLLMAHQDVVPVNKETAGEWTHPPYSGHFDGKYVWGRGSVDTKNTLIGSLSAAELLLEQGFKPKRTHVFSYGFDEEISGPNGAKNMAKFLVEKHGKKSFFSIVDEGSLIVEEDSYAMLIAATGEKGYTDLQISVSAPGGHSSMPPPHTGIGIAAQIIKEMEDTPYRPELTPQNPIFYTMQCIATHDKSISPKLKSLIQRSGKDRWANRQLVEILYQNPKYRDLIRTTQATDLMTGGVKANALPETTVFVTNHRIAIEHTVDDVKKKATGNANKIAKKNGFAISAFGKEIIPKTKDSKGIIEVEFFGGAMEVAPRAPTSGPTWDLVMGTAMHVFRDAVFPESKEVFAAPGIMTANTDTRHYWDLCDAIYRFNPVRETAAFGVHTVDERIEYQAHLEAIAYFYELVRNSGGEN